MDESGSYLDWQPETLGGVDGSMLAVLSPLSVDLLPTGDAYTFLPSRRYHLADPIPYSGRSIVYLGLGVGPNIGLQCCLGMFGLTIAPFPSTGRHSYRQTTEG